MFHGVGRRCPLPCHGIQQQQQYYHKGFSPLSGSCSCPSLCSFFSNPKSQRGFHLHCSFVARSNHLIRCFAEGERCSLVNVLLVLFNVVNSGLVDVVKVSYCRKAYPFFQHVEEFCLLATVSIFCCHLGLVLKI